MKTKQIKKDLKELEQKVKMKLRIEKSAHELIDLKQPDVSGWLNGRRKWSYEKIIKIAEKLEV